VWENFRGLFRAIDLGNEALGVQAYDGGLFEPDPFLDALSVPDEPQRKALVRFWDTCLAELQTVRLLDPACGSGAFLIEAFDQLHCPYQVRGRAAVSRR
jgi:hypothetical protein